MWLKGWTHHVFAGLRPSARVGIDGALQWPIDLPTRDAGNAVYWVVLQLIASQMLHHCPGSRFAAEHMLQCQNLVTAGDLLECAFALFNVCLESEADRPGELHAFLQLFNVASTVHIQKMRNLLEQLCDSTQKLWTECAHFRGVFSRNRHDFLPLYSTLSAQAQLCRRQELDTASALVLTTCPQLFGRLTRVLRSKFASYLKPWLRV